MKIAPKIAVLAAAIATSAPLPVMAQGVIQGPPVIHDGRDDPAYHQQMEEYRRRQAQYQASRETYHIQQDRYRADREAYLAARTAYDARYGSGAYDRRRVSWYQPYSNSPCERAARNGSVTGGVIGALAGAAIGSNVAARNARTEGAVLGGLVGGALGAGIGNSAARCDSDGYYYGRNQTVAYRDDWGSSDPYMRRGCRLAPAPAYTDGVVDYRYVRVCPDRRGRYRITG
jgi:hypothetical protein